MLRKIIETFISDRQSVSSSSSDDETNKMRSVAKQLSAYMAKRKSEQIEPVETLERHWDKRKKTVLVSDPDELYMPALNEQSVTIQLALEPTTKYVTFKEAKPASELLAEKKEELKKQKAFLTERKSSVAQLQSQIDALMLLKK